jgi:hypothetical protein
VTKTWLPHQNVEQHHWRKVQAAAILGPTGNHAAIVEYADFSLNIHQKQNT